MLKRVGLPVATVELTSFYTLEFSGVVKGRSALDSATEQSHRLVSISPVVFQAAPQTPHHHPGHRFHFVASNPISESILRLLGSSRDALSNCCIH